MTTPVTAGQRASDVGGGETDRPGDPHLERSVPREAGQGPSGRDLSREGLSKTEVDEKAKIVHQGSKGNGKGGPIRREGEDEGTARVHDRGMGEEWATFSRSMNSERWRVRPK
ncbi:MAG: hypothetical protein ACLQD9_03885 [Thermoplasmata archaeon]